MHWRYILSDIGEIALRFWRVTENKRVYAIHGEMGAGKTTFIHALCDARGVADRVSSPTFSLINEYEYEDENRVKKKIYHIDLYRLRNEEEARLAGIEDCLDGGHICLVEWPEKAPNLFPSDTFHVNIEVIDEQTRSLQFDNI